MSEIVTQPDDVTVPFEDEVNLLERLVDAGIPITHLCGGRARCSTCRVKIEAGGSGLAPRTEAEEAMARRLDFPDEIRLACQTRAAASLTLRRLVLDEADTALASQLGSHAYSGPVGREVEVAVMFADVAGFTSIAETLPAYDVMHILNRFFTGASDAIEANGGHVDNYMGDAVLALFGVNHEPLPGRAAIRSGLAVIEVAARLSHYTERVYASPFRVRVGIDYGPVVYGMLGAEGTARETAIGDAVNVASRLQGANKDIGTDMLVSDEVFEHCPSDVEFGRSFDLDLRGKVGRITAHEVVAIR